ncbi:MULTISPECIES: TetR/AcrR family transcriptional regulator [unclassified Mycolicibacterium]|uniref:TetR/AcrR family transcriptional regulator n=1 Tax=unclassified Mycolicibacterium TaxID=2636767 RepID=UPI0012DFB9CD|nr:MULTISPECIES: TetR/AcrR family transcriptional regulator [unclassified Mycolicibacterium]MUL80501.1 TetR/AcrR family transcriptional regulator [Mycolicibacterium sp. CBMA 329]MUL86268.1 TetR/AcrR family transcriptional regulator [Mycolicibacterium sp. CBMA 331]MUM01070.1 TetR/AcrR family transcriptional regulator [Mycolicibacterium sp. CBMA 334]MUM24964.1 TetR/AcrR family transcriptional regulator [Mycolicibacterium sp. CBMA 295]MUM36564.1 TetR/AcrR family transcriptional regulator [Mycolic
MLDTAMQLFLQYSFAGTSLQMIADELDLTKAAIYYHFRTREQLLIALMEPIFSDIAAVVEAAERKRGTRARAEAMLEGYADIVTRNRALAAVTTFDPSVRTVLRSQPEWAAVIDRQIALLAATDPSERGAVSAAVVLTGLAGGASSGPPHVDNDTLRAHLIDIGRRALGFA